MVHYFEVLYERTIKFRKIPTKLTMQNSCIKTTLYKYIGIIDALKEYKELDYINEILDITDDKNILQIYY